MLVYYPVTTGPLRKSENAQSVCFSSGVWSVGVRARPRPDSRQRQQTSSLQSFRKKEETAFTGTHVGSAAALLLLVPVQVHSRGSTASLNRTVPVRESVH